MRPIIPSVLKPSGMNVRRSQTLVKYWLAGAMAGAVFTMAVPWTYGQDAAEQSSSPAHAPGAPEAETAPPASAQGATQEPRFLPPRLRPKVLTPEEQEEAERLKQLAAKYGTDPTAIVGRVQLSGQYANLPQGAEARDGTLRVDLPFRKDFLLRVDTPFLKYLDPNRPRTTATQGLSDVSTLLGWRAYNTPEYAFLIGAVSTFPTADERTLGLGKYTTGPLIATARFLPRWDSFLFGVFQHQFSVGGDPARADISVTRAAAQINTFWAQRWWTIAQAVWQIDWERSAKSSMTVEFELGRNLVGRFGFYVRPGVGIWGRDLLGAYDWNIETGVRYVFPSL